MTLDNSFDFYEFLFHHLKIKANTVYLLRVVIRIKDLMKMRGLKINKTMYNSTDYFLNPLSDQIRSVAQSCPTLWDPMNRSTPDLPVHHQLPEFTQAEGRWPGSVCSVPLCRLSGRPAVRSRTCSGVWEPSYSCFYGSSWGRRGCEALSPLAQLISKKVVAPKRRER